MTSTQPTRLLLELSNQMMRTTLGRQYLCAIRWAGSEAASFAYWAFGGVSAWNGQNSKRGDDRFFGRQKAQSQRTVKIGAYGRSSQRGLSRNQGVFGARAMGFATGHQGDELGGGCHSKAFLSLTLAQFSKKTSEAQMHLDALTQMNRDHLTARNASEGQWQETILRVIDKLHQPAIQMVSPVGRSATTMKVASRTADPAFTVNEEMADTIRLGNKDVVEDAAPIKIVVDGVIHHSRQLKILHPEKDGKYLTANIRDPIFDSAPSPYHTAASQLMELNVLAKIVRRDGEVVGLFVLDIIR